MVVCSSCRISQIIIVHLISRRRKYVIGSWGTPEQWPVARPWVIYLSGFFFPA